MGHVFVASWPLSAGTRIRDYSQQVGKGRSAILAKAYSIAANDPQLADRAAMREGCSQTAHICQHGGFVLPLQPEDNDSSVSAGRVRLNICEIEVQRQQNSILRSTPAATVSSSEPDRSSSVTVSARKPELLRISAASTGKFSSTLNFTR